MNFISDNIKAIKDKDPAIKSTLEVILYASFWAMFFYRIAHKFYRWRLYFIARFISQLARFLTGIEIHPGAKIGKGFFIDHGMGVVIGETCEIGDNVLIYQGVTLGGTGKEKGKRHPTIEDNVLIGAGAKVLGPFTVGKNSRIGAGSVVLEEVPPNSTVVGVPARIAERCEHTSSPADDLIQQRLPDPVMIELFKLAMSLEEMQKSMNFVQKVTKEEAKNQPGGSE